MKTLDHWRKITFRAPKQGYAPAEDSWLLAQAIEKMNLQGKKCLDMGCGSGIQTAALLLSGAESVVCVDLNTDALHTTKKMIENNFPKAPVSYVESNLFEKIKPKEPFDIIVFNPPYVPSEKIKWMEVDGGKKGREVIDVFLKQLPQHLACDGICFLLQSSLNGNHITQKKCQQMGLKTKIVEHQKMAFEELTLLLIERA